MRDSTISWQKKLAQGFSTVASLLEYLELPQTLGEALAEKAFPTRVPLSYAQRMQKNNPRDPLLLQVLSTASELSSAQGYVTDPLEEKKSNPQKGIIHKYKGRLLITLTGACAVNCRFCFRRHFPYQDNNIGRNGLHGLANYIRNDPSITEVILSGGDPLLAADAVFMELLQLLEQIEHVHTLRMHSRIPVVFPARIDERFLKIFSETRLKKVLVLHINHPQELADAEVKSVLTSLAAQDFFLLNQSVLLAGINDDASILAELSQRLFQHRILPYYLHILDKVQGAAHFDMDLSQAKEIFYTLQKLVPGYLLPRLVKEEPGKLSKTLIL